MPAPRRRRPGRDLEPGCLGAPSGNAQKYGLQCHPHQPQPAGPGIPGPLRPNGLPGAGRTHGHLDLAQEGERLCHPLRRVGRKRPGGPDSPGPQPPFRDSLEHWQRMRGAGRQGALVDSPDVNGHLPQGGPHPSHHRRQRQPLGRRPAVRRHPGRVWLQLQTPPVCRIPGHPSRPALLRLRNSFLHLHARVLSLPGE